MIKFLLPGLLMLICCAELSAQKRTGNDSLILITLNQQIDNLVIQRDTAALNKLYAPDFVFSHGSGRIEGKQGWYSSVMKGSFLLRQHDSVTVEQHPGMAILRGRLVVQKKNAGNISNYQLKYIRVYVHRKKAWQLASHVTYWEQHN